jgi:hypothetical protein
LKVCTDYNKGGAHFLEQNQPKTFKGGNLTGMTTRKNYPIEKEYIVEEVEVPIKIVSPDMNKLSQ